MPTADIGLTPGQLTYARQIVAIGKKRGMSERDIITALTVALDESGLQNYANSSVPTSLNIPHDAVGSDHASVGIFQQQVGIWGTASELMNPTTAANKFYDALAAVKARNTMTIPQAAQTVQKSATPDGSNYAVHVDKATTLYNTVSGSKVNTASWLDDAAGAIVGGMGSPPVQALMNVGKAGEWITKPDNWKRIGLFALGSWLVLFVVWTLLSETKAVKTALHVAGKIV